MRRKPEVFHTMEKLSEIFAAAVAAALSLAARWRGAIDLAFARRLLAWARHSAIPHHGKTFGDFSTLWKKVDPFFHTVEKYFPHCGKILWTAWAASTLAWAAGCATVKANRLAIPKVVHWTVTAADAAEGHGPELAVDGRGDTWWQSGGGTAPWLQVDLARPAMVCGFSLQWGEPHATAYAVQTSLDGTHWALGYETKDGDGDWDQVSIEPVLARYLRVEVAPEGLPGAGVALAALEIKGLADQPQAWVDGAPNPGAAALLDGNPATTWQSRHPAATVELDLRSSKPVGSVRVDWGTNGFASNVVVEISTNRADWTSVGRIQPRAGDFDVVMNETVRPAQFVRLSFSGGTGADGGFEVAGITLRGGEGAARPWALYELAASHAPEGVYPDVFRKRQTYWTAVGGPKAGDAECRLDEWGVFAAQPRGATLAPLLVMDGQVLSAHQAARVEHRLGGDGAPMPETVWRMDSGLALRIRALSRPGAPAPMACVQYELANESIMVQTGRLCWVVRPVRLAPVHARSGLAPIHKLQAAANETGWQELWVNDEPLFAVPEAGLPFGAAAFEAGDVTEYFRRGETPLARAVTDENGLASGAWWRDFTLQPGEKLRMVIAANAQPSAEPGGRRFPWPDVEGLAEKAADAFEREWVDEAWAWRDETGRYFPRIDRPEASECLRAQTGWLLSVHGADGDDLEAVSLRVAALLRAGQPAAARGWIERVAATVQTNGWVPALLDPVGALPVDPVQLGRHATQGQFAFLVLEYFRFTQDTAFLHEMYPRVRSAMAYVQALRAELEKTEWKLPEDERYLLEGLLPVSGARPGSPKPVHLFADHYWTLLGWKECRTAASLLGLNDDAAWADEQYRLLKSSVRRSLRARMDQMTGSWIPASAEEERLDIDSVALLFWPCEETDLVEPHELQTSLDTFYAEFLLRRHPDWNGLIPSDEGLLLIPLAAMGRGEYVREVLYSLLDRRQPKGWNVWPDVTSSDPRQIGQIGDMPDIRAASSYLIGVRGIAARESGKRLDLFSGAPWEWLQHGEGFRVYGMPTAFGPLDLAGYWCKKEFTVEIGGGAEPPEGYRIWWPHQMTPERVLANGTDLEDFDSQGAVLPHDFKGKVEVIFPLSAPWPRDP